MDTQSWGACLCWENGARRSKWGQSVKCVAALPVETIEEVDPKTIKPVTTYANDANCVVVKDGKHIWSDWAKTWTGKIVYSQEIVKDKKQPRSADSWCTQTLLSDGVDGQSSNQVCPIDVSGNPGLTSLKQCQKGGTPMADLPEGMEK